MTDIIGTLGDPDVFVTEMVLFLLWLWMEGLRHTLTGMATGLTIAVASTLALKLIVATPGITTWPDGILVSQYFPSGHAALATAIYGSVAIVLAAASGGVWRYAPIAALALSVAVAAGRVISRTHPIGDAFFGMIIGLSAPVATYFAVIRETHPFPHAGIILIVFLAAGVAGWFLPAPIHTLSQW